MEVIGVIVVLVVIFIIGSIITYLRNQATKALNRGLFNRDGHARGQNSTQETIEFVAPVDAGKVIETVKSRVALADVAPAAFVAALYLAGEAPGALVFKFGNKVSQTFRSVLMSEDLPGGGSKTVYTVTNWVLADGIVRGITEMELLANSIRSVAAEVGGSYGTTLPSAPAAAPIITSEPVAASAAFCTACGSPNLGERFCTECGAAVA
jgi:hypothetical protein